MEAIFPRASEPVPRRYLNLAGIRIISILILAIPPQVLRAQINARSGRPEQVGGKAQGTLIGIALDKIRVVYLYKAEREVRAQGFYGPPVLR